MFSIIGHKRIILFLEKSIANHKLSHAYLFYGPNHIGKSKVAEYFAASLLCLNKVDGAGPCGECASCQQVSKKIHPDVYWVSEAEDKDKISINQIRQLQEALILTPLSGNYKIAIIENAENLTIQAANSFLKLLEEAPKNTIIILLARSFHSVLPTIRSRCQNLRFSCPSQEEIQSFLEKRFNSKPETIEFILSLSQDQPGLAIELAENPEKLSEFQGVADEFINLLVENNSENKFKLADSIQDGKILSQWLKIIRYLILARSGADSKRKFLQKSIDKIIKKYTQKELSQIAQAILRAQFYLQRNVNQKLVIEDLLINI